LCLFAVCRGGRHPGHIIRLWPLCTVKTARILRRRASSMHCENQPRAIPGASPRASPRAPQRILRRRESSVHGEKPASSHPWSFPSSIPPSPAENSPSSRILRARRKTSLEPSLELPLEHPLEPRREFSVAENPQCTAKNRPRAIPGVSPRASPRAPQRILRRRESSVHGENGDTFRHQESSVHGETSENFRHQESSVHGENGELWNLSSRALEF
jgi:hypothetical protein